MVLITLPVSELQKSRLSSSAGDNEIVYLPESALTEELVSQASVIIGWVKPAMIKASEKLELLQLFSAGADAFTAPGILSGSTVLCNASGAYSKAVSEHAFALTLMLIKKLHLYRDAQSRSCWCDYGPVISPEGASVLVAGLGDIGNSYAKLMKSMGSYIIGVKRSPAAASEWVDELVLTEDIDSALSKADIVLSVLPGTKETLHFFGIERFGLMKRGVYFINCGRGNVVDEKALSDALGSGQIAAAAIDVAEHEPLSPDSPLWKQENLVITPHVAGSYHLPDILEGIVDISCENLVHWRTDKQYRNIVDKKLGY